MKNEKNADLPFHEEKPRTRTEMQSEIASRLERIDKEFKEAFEFIQGYTKSVTFFGSARFREDDEYYKKAEILAGKIAKELDYAILTGGGGGIMDAGNKGAFEAKGKSVGLNIRLPKEQNANGHTTNSMTFYYFFTRKVALSFAAEAYVFFPGGFGTLDEFFEILTLVQTRKIPRVPIILYGNEYWSKLNTFISEELLKKYATINHEDMSLYTITEDNNKILDIIKSAPIHQTG